jgi:hypothetical protein
MGMIQPAYWESDNSKVLETCKNLDERYDWFCSNALTIKNPEIIQEYRRLQENGVGIMLHLPFAYVNVSYLNEPLFKAEYDLMDKKNGWLRDKNGEIVKYPEDNYIVDMTNALVISEYIKLMVKYLKQFNFTPNAWFIDYIWDKISWVDSFSNPEQFDAKWKTQSYYAITLLKFKFATEGLRFYVNGWHHCKSADAMAYETFPYTLYENGQRDINVCLFGEYGVKNHQKIFKQHPLLLPAGGSGIGNNIPKNNLIGTASFAKAFACNSIIVDNSKFIFNLIDELGALQYV